MKLSSLLPLAFLGQAVNALSPAEWRKQSIYFLLTDRFGRTNNSTSATCNTEDRAYCGGSWQGIINHLDYIQGMGFTAIWITPVTGQLYDTTDDGTSYHGYWQQHIYTLNAHLGDASDLKALSAALHARGMYLMVDVVANHMGFHGAGASTDYSVFDAFPSSDYFHSYCAITNYDDQTNVEDCWLGDSTVSLPDLNTELDSVRSIWQSWVAGLVANYSIDGLRIDTVKHVEKTFWSGYNDAAGVYCVGEVFDGDPAYACDYQNYMDGVLNYPVYYPLLAAFQSTSGSISNLYSTIASVASRCADPTLLGNFVENHDNPRFASYTSDYALAKNALSFLFLADGIPIVYAGQEQHYSGGADPANREATWLSGYATTATLYAHIATTNQIRRLAMRRDSGWATVANSPFYQDDHTIAMLKGSTTAAGSSSSGKVLTVLSNKGTAGDSYTLSLGSTGYAAGATLVELYSCATVTVDSSGNVPVPMASGQPRVLVPSAWVSDSGLCGTSATATGAATTATATATTAATATSAACASATAVPVLFSESVTTSYGENVFIVGSAAQLGSWNTGSAVALSSSDYTSSNPVWKATVSLPAGLSLTYKFIKKESDGSIVWESDPNRTYTVPTGCSGVSATITASWR